ncbi:MAG: hypothetical protein ACOYYJ_05660 [Chloroflexota bacterium]
MNAQEIVTSVLAVAMAGVVAALLFLGIPVPEPLWAGFGLVLGFYFGNQTGTARARAR